jgi:hypothetical protein
MWPLMAMPMARQVDIAPDWVPCHSMSRRGRYFGAHDEKLDQINANRLSPAISRGMPDFERRLSESDWESTNSREPSRDGEGQRRLRLCLLENKILLLHD